MLRFLFSAIATLLVLPIVLGLFRRALGGADPEERRRAAGEAGRRGHGRRGKGRRPGSAAGGDEPIDRSTVIDVPFTEERGEPHGAPREADSERR